jgi:hypothetical protein
MKAAGPRCTDRSRQEGCVLGPEPSSGKLRFGLPRLNVAGADEEDVTFTADIAEQPVAFSFSSVEIRAVLYQPPYLKAVTDGTKKRISQGSLP